MSKSMLQIPVDDDTKRKASLTLEALGLSLSDAVGLFLRRVAADRAMPFDVKAPNAETRAAMAEADLIIASGKGRFGNADALFSDLEKTGFR